ncbi:MAG: type II toxin-antitoxin system VapC family toxin [Archangium sp.]|nr:type II toxin-antitoxin system VapC family toxin [Archangium sp.]
MKLLDSNACIAVLNGRNAAVSKRFLAEREDLVICSVVKAELLFGARASAQVTKNLERLKAFFALLPSLQFDDDAAAEYGLLRALLKRAGTPIGANDLLIASIALAHDASVVTHNTREFIRVPALHVETW